MNIIARNAVSVVVVAGYVAALPAIIVAGKINDLSDKAVSRFENGKPAKK